MSRHTVNPVSRSAVFGIAVFVGLMVLGLAAADKPPPPGFLLVVAMAAAVGLGVWWRAPRWQQRIMPGVRDGALTGLVSAVVLLFSGGALAPWWAPVVFVGSLVAIGALGGALVALAFRTKPVGRT